MNKGFVTESTLIAGLVLLLSILGTIATQEGSPLVIDGDLTNLGVVPTEFIATPATSTPATNSTFLIGTSTPEGRFGTSTLIVYGSTTIQTSVNTAHALDVLDSDSSSVFAVSTLDGAVTIGGTLTVGSCSGCGDGGGGTGSNFTYVEDGSPDYIRPSTTVNFLIQGASTTVRNLHAQNLRASTSLAVDGISTLADSFIVDGSGLVIGNNAQITAGTASEFQVLGTGPGADSSVIIGRWVGAATDPALTFVKSRNTTIGSFTIVQDNDSLGSIAFYPDDGVDYQTLSANFFAEVDDPIPSAGDIGTAFVWNQMLGDGSAITEGMRLSASSTLTVRGGIISQGASSTVRNLQAQNIFASSTLTVDGAVNFSAGGALTGTWTDLGTVSTVDINGGSLDGATIGAASPSTIVGTTITVNTSLLADADDGAVIGASGTGFSDLFLASGAVINFNAGDITLTHSANTLTITGGITVLDTASTIGTLTLANGSITDSSGAISFGNENLTTTGTLASGALTVTGAILPNADDGGALGASGTEWSDLFLNTGGVINWEAGDVTITHASNLLTFGGGRVDFASGFVSQASSTISSTATTTLTVAAPLNLDSMISFSEGTNGINIIYDGGANTLRFQDIAANDTFFTLDRGANSTIFKNEIDIPSAASTTLEAEGQIEIDTTDISFNFYADSERSIPALKTIGFSISSTTGAMRRALPFTFPYGLIITEVNVKTDVFDEHKNHAGYNFNICHGTDIGVCTNLFSADINTTSTTTYTVRAPSGDRSAAANEQWFLTTSAASSSKWAIVISLEGYKLP